MARLAPKDWQKIREVWETTDKKGFGWLSAATGLKVSRQAVEKRAKAEAWAKSEALKVAPKVAETPKVAQKVAKKAQPKVQLATKSATENPDISEVINSDSLTETEQLFVLEYCKDFNASKAAERAGLKGKNPRNSGYKLLHKDAVQLAIRNQIATRATKIGVDGERLMQLWADIVNFDTNELVELRRVPCPYCYAVNGTPQMTTLGYYVEKRKHEKLREQILASSKGETDIGEYPSALTFSFVDPNKRPNPDCKVCHGLGEELRILKDTRDLSPSARQMYCGVETIKGDLNVVMLNKDKAIDNLAKALFLFKEREEEAVDVTTSPEKLTELFAAKMKKAEARQAKAFAERGIEEAVDVEFREVVENGAKG